VRATGGWIDVKQLDSVLRTADPLPHLSHPWLSRVHQLFNSLGRHGVGTPRAAASEGDNNGEAKMLESQCEAASPSAQRL
jgi:hypothetical protein